MRDIASLATLDATSGLVVDVELGGDLDGLEPSTGTALYRVAQEAVTNARRHARRASRVRVCVAGDDETIRLDVDDDGEGGPTGRQSGFGLVGMLERVEMLGGTLEAGPGSAGWSVRVTIPRHGSA